MEFSILHGRHSVATFQTNLANFFANRDNLAFLDLLLHPLPARTENGSFQATGKQRDPVAIRISEVEFASTPVRVHRPRQEVRKSGIARNSESVTEIDKILAAQLQ